MLTPRRLESGPPAPKPPPRGRLAGRWALVLIALGALALEGCQSLQTMNPFRGGGCKGCGPGGGLFGRRRQAELYEPPIIAEPGGIVADEIVSEPPYDSGTVITTPPASVSPAPPTAPSDDPLELSPLPAPSGGSGRSNGSSAAPKVGRAAEKPAGKNNSLARNDSASGLGRGGPAPLSLQVLDDLPEPAAEVRPTIGLSDTPPASDPVDPSPADAVPALGVGAGADRVPGPSALTSTPAEAPPSAVSGPTPPSPPAPPADAQTWAAPGIRTFSGVGPQLAAGSFPEKPGWEYLAQKGYKTILDLRDIAEVRPDDLAEIHHRGLRHIMLPLPIDKIDAATFKRFQEEIDLAGARPLYFCDTDGSRAAALWYARRVVTDKVDHSLARRDAEIVGPLTAEGRAKAEALTAIPSIPLPQAPLAPAPEQAPAAAASSPPASAPASDAPPAPAPTPEPAAPPAEVPAVAAENTPDPLVSTDGPPVRDPGAWRPYAALFLSILVVPLAYWSSGSLSLTRRKRALASLEARERKLRSLPPSSDA